MAERPPPAGRASLSHPSATLHELPAMTTDPCGAPDPIVGWHPCTLPVDHDGLHTSCYSVYKVVLDITEHYTLAWSLDGIAIGDDQPTDTEAP